MRRRLALLLTAVVAATSAALVPTSAQAVDVPFGTITPGDPVQVTVGTNDTAVFDVTIPPNAGPTVTLGDITGQPDIRVDLVGEDGIGLGGSNYVVDNGEDPWLGLPRTPDAPGDQQGTLRVHAFAGGSFTLLLQFGAEQRLTVGAGEAVPLTFTTPGERAVLTFEAETSGEVYVAVSDVDLTRSVTTEFLDERITATLGSTGERFSQVQDRFFPQLINSGTDTVVIDPLVDFVGTLTVRVSPVPVTSGDLFYEQAPRETFLFTPDQPVRLHLRAQGGARTVVQVVDPQLTAGDGGPGRAAVSLTLSGLPPVALGTVGSGLARFETPAALDDGRDGWLTIEPLDGTTGTLSVRVTLDPGALPVLPLDVDGTLSVPPGSTTARYAIDAEAGDGFEFSAGLATYGQPGAQGVSNVQVDSPTGSRVTDFFISSFFPSSASFTADVPGRYVVTVTVDPPIGLTADLRVSTVETLVETATSPFDGVLTIPAPGRNVALEVPGVPGRRLVFSVSDAGLTGQPEGIAPATVSLLAADGSVVGDAELQAGGTTQLETPVSADDAAYRLLVDGRGAVTGDVRVVTSSAEDVIGSLVAGTAVPVVLGEAANARFTFTGRVGSRIEVVLEGLSLDDPTVTGGAAVRLVRPDGSTLTENHVFAGQTSLVVGPQDGLDADGTWTLVVDPFGSTTAAFTATLVEPTVTTSPLRLGTARTVTFRQVGQVQRLTFDAAAGRRPVVELLDLGVPTRLRLLAPDGSVLVDVPELDSSFEASELPVRGTYVLELDPLGLGLGSVTVRVTAVADPVRTVESGDRVTTSFAPGQNPTYRVRLKAGERIALDVENAVTTAGADWSASVEFRQPDGVIVGFRTVSDAVRWTELDPAAQVPGVWSVVVNPAGLGSGRLTTRFWVSKDKTATARLGRPVRVSVDTPGQRVVFPIEVTSTSPLQAVHWEVTGSTIPRADWKLVSPFGFDWDLTTFTGVNPLSGTSFIPFSSPGTWQLVLDPETRSTGRATVTLTLVDAPGGGCGNGEC